ncbi:hypothetical protein ACIQW5_25395 [Methylorubrum thiocyanatum]|uniref:hypothetical protein n=1 Tax=Methylorubrum thiocyanatum TaxID=47958 RepID=UPI00383BDD2B
MRDVLCLGSRAIALVRERLEAPGVLVGRARSDEYRARFDLFASWMIERHGLAAYQHTFPLSREHVGKILGLPPAAIQRLVERAVSIGLLVTESDLVRRWKTGFQSLTQGSNGAWFEPYQWDIGPDFLALLPRRQDWDSEGPVRSDDGTRFAPPPLGSHSDQDKPSKVRDRLSKGEPEPETFEIKRIPGSDRIEILSGFDGPIGGVNEAIEDALDDYRQAHVPDAMPDHPGRDRRPVEIIPEADFERLLKARMAAKYGRTALSDEARATVPPLSGRDRW